MLLSYVIGTIIILPGVSWYQSLAFLWGEFSLIFIASGRGHRGQVPNEEVSYHECSIQDVMIEDLYRQVAELIQSLAL